MARNEHYEQLAQQLERRLQKTHQAYVALGEDLASAQEALDALVACSAPTLGVSLSPRSSFIGLVNGHRIKDEELENLDEDKYDIILDMRVCSLRYRFDPEEHSELEPSHRRNVGKHRLPILKRMLIRPGVHFDAARAYACYGERRSSGAFSRTISDFRQALGKPGLANPYILTLPASGESCQPNACAYTANPQWKYLVIDELEKLMGKST